MPNSKNLKLASDDADNLVQSAEDSHIHTKNCLKKVNELMKKQKVYLMKPDPRGGNEL